MTIWNRKFDNSHNPGIDIVKKYLRVTLTKEQEQTSKSDVYTSCIRCPSLYCCHCVCRLHCGWSDPDKAEVTAGSLRIGC